MWLKILVLIPQVSAHAGEGGAPEAGLGDVYGPILAVLVIVIAVAVRKIIANNYKDKKLTRKK